MPFTGRKPVESETFRRFFELIGRLERQPPPLEVKSEPPRKARITRLDGFAGRSR